MATYQVGKYADDEKVAVTNIEKIESNDSDVVNEARIHAFTDAEQKRIWRRIDRRLVLTLGFMYCVSLMDRTNTGIAVVAGMGVDLYFKNFDYSTIVLVFFITYVALQPPATVVLRKVGPRIFLPAIVILWGITMISFGFVKTWTDLIPLRLVLGIFEAGFFPGCAYLLSCWYPRYHLQKRNAVFYLIGSMSSAFSGILAYGFSLLAGHGSGMPKWMGAHHYPTAKAPHAKTYLSPGIAGWRWIFILQGLLTVVIGAIGWFFIVDFPELCNKPGIGKKFLTEKEAQFVVATIEQDRHDAIPEEFNIKKYLKNAMDSKVWGFAWLFGLTTTMTYAIAYFLPIILKDGMGFSTEKSQCLIAPPYLFAAVVGFAEAYYSDKTHKRGIFIILNGCMALAGLGLLGFATNVGARYTGVFLATAAANANIPCVLTFQANNIRGQWKRALASATLVGAGGIGGIVGSTVFRSQDNPKYIPGMIACLVAAALIIVITLLMQLKFARANKRAAAGGKIIEGLVGFRYTL